MQGETRYILLSEASRLSGYSAEHLRRLCIAGKIESHRTASGSWVTTQEAVKKFVEESKNLAPISEAEPSPVNNSSRGDILIKKQVKISRNNGLLSPQQFALLALALVMFFPVAFAAVNVQDKISSLKDKTNQLLASTIQKHVKEQLAALGVNEGSVAGSVILNDSEGSDPRKDHSAAPQNDKPREWVPQSTPYLPQVLGISNDEVIAALRATLQEGLPQDILIQLKGEKGDPGVTVSYTLPTSTNTSSMGTIAGFTHLGGQDLSTQNLTVTNNITQTGGTASFTTLTVAGEDVVTLTGTQTLSNKTLLSSSGNISQWTNDSGYLSSGSALTGLVQSTAAGNSYFTGGNLGIGTNDPQVKLDVSGHLRVMNQNEIRFADSDSSNYVGFKSPSTVGANTIWTLPSADASGCFQSNGAGLISIASCSAAAVSAGGLTNDFRGLQLRTATDGDALKKVTLVHVDEIVTKDGTRHTPANNLHADITVSGIGGLRAGQTEAASTWYKIMYAYGSSGEGIYLEQAKDYFLDESTTTGAATTALRGAATETKLAQTFDTDVTGPVEFVDVKVEIVSNPPGLVWASIYATSGGVPTGAALKTSDKLDASIGQSTAAFIRFVFRDPLTLTAGTTYALVLEGDWTINGTDYVNWMRHTASTYADGSGYTYNGTTWTALASSLDFVFKVYVTRNDNVPTPPSGYNTSYAHIGWVFNNASSNFVPFVQNDKRVAPLIHQQFASTASTIPILADVSAYLPPTSLDVELGSVVDTVPNALWAGGVPDGFEKWPSTGGSGVVRIYLTTAQEEFTGSIKTETQGIYVHTFGGTASYYLRGYTWSTSNIGTPAGAGGTQVWLLNDQNEAYYSTANVGIGTGDPTAKLEVFSDSAPVIQATRSTALTNISREAIRLLHKTSGNMADEFGSQMAFAVQDDAAGPNVVATISGIRSGSDTAGALTFGVGSGGGTEAMRINASGNVGIGTTSPQQLLHVYANANSTTPRLRISNVSTGATAGSMIEFENSADTARSSIMQTSTGWAGAVYQPADGMLIMSQGPGGLWFNSNNGGGFQWWTTTTGSAKMTMNSSGNIAVSSAGPHSFGGAVSAAQAFLLQGAFSGAGGSDVIGFNNDYVLTGQANTNIYGSNFADSFTEAGSGTHSLVTQVRIVGRTITNGGAATTDAASLYITGAMAGATNNYAMWVDDGNARFDGNVGIGTATPGAMLHVYHPSGNGIIMQTSASPQLNQWAFRLRAAEMPDGEFSIYDVTNSAHRLYIKSNGNVGLGGTSGIDISPDFGLEVGNDSTGTAGKPGGGSWSDSSDRRLKTNITELDDALETLLSLKPVSYEWINADRHIPGIHAGFIAQDVEEVFPKWVHIAGVDGEDKALIPEGEEAKAIYFPFDFNAYVVGAIKELNEKLTIYENSSGQIEVQDNTEGVQLSNIKTITSISGKWSIDENGIVIAEEIKAKKGEFEQLKVQNPDQAKTGITIYDRMTGTPVCVYSEYNILKSSEGECGVVAGVNAPEPPAEEETPPSEPEAEEPPTEEPPVEEESPSDPQPEPEPEEQP